MNKRLAVLFLGFTACNYDAGECYVRREGGEGVGGNAITPGGAGGYGDVPPEPAPEPQGAPSPVDPCQTTAECTVTWKAGSDYCKEKGATGSCTSLYQGPHVTLAEAKERCEVAHGAGKSTGVESCGPCHWVTSASGDCLDHCKELCDQIVDKCKGDCKSDPSPAACRSRCMDDYGKCLKECDKKCKG